MGIVLAGYLSLLGGLGLVMDIPFFVFTISAIFLLIIFELYYVFRFKDVAKEADKYDLNELETKITRYNWPEFVFLLAVAVIIFFVPWTVISLKIALSATQVLIAILLASYAFFVLRAHLNKFEIINLPLINRWRFMQKKW
jgi:MFS superfamily sulfate permease-like transporter